MFGKKEVITAVGTLGCAIGIGFVMQSSDTAEVHYGEPERIAPAPEMPELKSVAAQNAILDVQEITLTSAEFDQGITVPKTDDGVIKASIPTALPEPDVPEPAVAPLCDITATAHPIAAAMVTLSMEASCFPNERVTVHHNGMIFTETTSDTGTLVLTVPALVQESVFIVAFPNGEGAVAQTTVEELADFDRAVLQWKGTTGFQIHAREFGADYGTEGHLWEGQPGDIASAVTGTSGVMTRHGDISAAEPLLAEVYSFPRGSNARVGSIALSVETEVTTANCGLEIEAQSLEILADGQIKTQNLTLSVPDCDAEGSFLVLNNLLQDMKVAGN
ncbi:MAG: hypothetical protein ABJL67_20120 [Sulfitobacter sp.]